MTRTPTDRGVVFVQDQPDGTQLIYVAVGIAPDGTPQEIFAVHRATAGRTVEIDPAVRMIPAGKMRRSSEPVRVFGAPDAIHVQATSKAIDMDKLLA